jgi:hypothetical protein
MQRRTFLHGLGASFLFFQLNPIFLRRKWFSAKRPQSPPYDLRITAVAEDSVTLDFNDESMAIVSYEASTDNGPWLDLNDASSPVTPSGLLPGTTYSSFRLRSRDAAGNESDPSDAVGPVTTDAVPATIHYQISCGFPGIAGASPYEDDTLHSYFGGTGLASGSYGTVPDLTGLVNPAPVIVYRGFRYNTAGNTFTYTFPVTALKDYKIRLHYGVNNSVPFNNASCPINVTINGVAKPTFDPFVDAGSPGVAKGFIKEFTITQGSGTSLTILFAGNGSDQPFVMGIEVIETAALSITTIALPDGSIGSAYSQTLTTANASGAVTWAITSGSLPAGLSLNASTGVISGTPTTLQNLAFLVQATDSKSPTPQTYLRAFSILVDTPLSSFILDTISATALRAYSTRKLRSAYAGACWRIQRASDSTQTDIGFNSNGKIDKVAIATFAAGTTYKIVKVYDQSTTNDPLVPNVILGASEPTGALNHFLGSRAGIDFGTAGDKALSSVANISTTNPKVYLAVHCKQVSNRDFEFLFACAGANRGAVLKGMLSMYGNGYHNAGRFDGGTHQMTFWFTSGDDKVIIDGVDHPCLATSSSSTNCGNGLASGIPFALGAYHAAQTGDCLSGVIGECIVFDGTVSGPDDAALRASQDAFFINAPAAADPLAFHNLVIMEGDSLTFGYQATTNPPTLVQTAKGSDWQIRNISASGQELITQMTPDAPIEADAYYDARYTKNILTIWAGINDFHNHSTMTAATLETALQSYVAARKAAATAVGVTLKVLVVTITACDPANGYITSGQQTERTTFNTWLRANWNSFADGLCDLDGITQLQNPTDATIYHNIGGGDFGLHFTDLAYNTYIGPAFVTAINALWIG